MKIAFNITPLKSIHKERGTGYYTANLLEGLKKEKDLEIIEFSNLADIKGKVDGIHFPWFDFYFHTLPIGKSFPCVVTIHDVIPLLFKNHYPPGLRGKINFLLQKLALKNCRFVITDSLASKRDIVKYLKFKEDKVIVVPLASDEGFKQLNESKLLFFKRKYNLANRFMLYVGDANFVKNLPFLIDCFKDLVKSPDLADLKLVLAGGVFLKNLEGIDHPELDSLKKALGMIKQYNLEDKVLRPGKLETADLVAFYNLATVYAQPSFYEGFGLPILQAFACGTPVLSSNRGALPEVGGAAAIYFDPNNKLQFISQAKEVLANKSLQNKLSRFGLKQAAKFSWEKTVAETRLVYEKIKS
ncbi:glycosyltransferase family 4 protein [Candidatus Daviesbacteria bacterium]|nr:glycosyltransferase family 4 protein [Candidatus Daviesbacteria bacterium]